MQEFVSINKFLFKKVYLVLAISLTFIGSVLFYLVNSNLKGEILKRQQINQDNLIQQSSNDLLSGLDFMVYKKCKTLFSDIEVIGLVFKKANGEEVCRLSSSSEPSYVLSSSLFFDENKKTLAAEVQVRYSKKPLYLIQFQVLFVLAIFLLFVLFLVIRAKKELKKSIQLPLERLAFALKGAQEGKVQTDFLKSEITEVSQIHDSIRLMNDHLEKFRQEVIIKTKDKAFADMARQVAHDIQSPLMALNTLAKSENKMSEKNRELLKMAIQRVNDISIDLLNKKNTGKAVAFQEAKVKKSVQSVLGEILVEKRAQYVERLEVNMSLSTTSSDPPLYSVAPEGELKRAISNVVNNAFEAIEATGSINIKLSSRSNYIVILVHDDGCGMSSIQVKNATEAGFSQGKKQSGAGFGLGLYGVKKFLDQFEGKLVITSKLGKGTAIEMSIPQLIQP